MKRLAVTEQYTMDNRQLERISLPRPLLISSGVLGYADSAAVLRDINAAGAYFYTLLPLSEGDVVQVFVTLADASGTANMSFTGTVVRVEKGVTDNSLGVGVSFSDAGELDDEAGKA